jgi:hypothetical protein
MAKQHRSILVPHRWVEAGRVRKCHHDAKHEIVKGDRVLEIKVNMAWFGYCRSCGEEMIRQGIAKLQDV